MKVQSGTEHYHRNEKEGEWNWCVGLIQIESKSDKRGQICKKTNKQKVKYLDMLRDVFVVLFLVFKGPVAGVAKMRKLWLFPFVLLWIAKSCGHQIAICVSLLCDKSQNWLSLVTFLP